jgi:hypothetical protein
VQDHVLAAYPDRRVRVYVVWFNMVRTDARDRWPNNEIVDARARHLWDEGKLVGRAIAADEAHRGWRPVAWDVWLLFAPESEWAGRVPAPVESGRTIIRTRNRLDARFAALPRQEQTMASVVVRAR